VSTSTADTALAVAAAALAIALVLLAVVVWQIVQLRRMRRAQRVLLGTDQRDLVEYAMGLLARVESMEERAGAVEELVGSLGQRVDFCVQRRGIVRYDALGGAGGRQSFSVALLDAPGSGLVVTAIQDREYARIYAKELREGEADVELSPEEQSAISAARGR
jgi:uncharacterized protein DUF4446